MKEEIVTKPLVQKEVRSGEIGRDHGIGRQMRKLAGTVLGTEASIAALLARLTLAVVMFPHGVQKVFGWFGGGGFSGTMNFFIETMHIPWIFALAAILAEFLGPVALALGVGTRIAAFAIATNMIVAALSSHLQHGFFMDWFRNQNGEGFEYHLLHWGCVPSCWFSAGEPLHWTAGYRIETASRSKRADRPEAAGCLDC